MLYLWSFIIRFPSFLSDCKLVQQLKFMLTSMPVLVIGYAGKLEQAVEQYPSRTSRYQTDLWSLCSQASGLRGEASFCLVLRGRGSPTWRRLWPPRPITPPSSPCPPQTSCPSGWERVRSTSLPQGGWCLMLYSR